MRVYTLNRSGSSMGFRSQHYISKSNVGDRFIYLGFTKEYRTALQAIEVVEIVSGNVTAKILSDGSLIQPKDERIIDKDDPDYHKMFSKHAADHINLTRLEYDDIKSYSSGTRVIVRIGSMLVTGSLVVNGEDTSIMYSDGVVKSTSTNSEIFNITDNPNFTIQARGLTRVSRLELGSLDY